jgi:3-hydroxyisobutyrate dehydrogenase-like beta-hydroxyacid dehydrogenase
MLKLVNNALFTAQVSMADDAVHLLADLGLDVRQSMAAIAASTGSSRCIQMYVETGGVHVFPRHSDGRARGAELLAKDIALLDSMTAQRAVRMPAQLADTVRAGLRSAVAAGRAETAVRPGL